MRLFISINFDEEILNSLIEFQEKLKACGVRGNFAPRENLHLTLAFIGEFGDANSVLDAINSVDFAPTKIVLDGMGYFGNLYWVGIARNPELFNYVKKLRHALSKKNIPFNRKKFSPHITIVRRAEFFGESQLPHVEPPIGEMQAQFVSLMSSTRGKNGMIYTELGRV